MLERFASFVTASLVVALSGCTVQDSSVEEAAQEDVATLPMAVLTTQSAKSVDEDWGTFREYFAGETAGLTDLLSGTATINPGQEIHPPHRHAEEEFLMVMEGEGEWTIGDEVFPAKAGDMLYSPAWDLHGIKNTGDKPLTFVFWKAHPKGMPVPVDPEL